MLDENKSRHIEQYPKEITRQDDSMSKSLQQPDNIILSTNIILYITIDSNMLRYPK